MILMAKTKPPSQTRPPDWAAELAEKYQSGIAHAFILHGNVQDYIGGLPGQSLKNYLISSFGERDIVASWNRAGGFSLPTTDMRRKFIEITGIPLPLAASGTSQLPMPRTTGRSGFASGLNAMATDSSSTDLTGALEKIRQPGDALDFLTRLLRAKSAPAGANRHSAAPGAMRTAVIIDYAESIAPAVEAAASETDRTVLVTLSEWGRDTDIASRDHILIMIA